MCSSLAGTCVLLVEDDMFVAWMLQDVLAELGCDVVGPATRVERALTLVATEHVQVSILDINLNGEVSFPVADALAGLQIPFIFLTGYTADILPERHRHRPLMRKPFPSLELRRALTSLLPSAEM